MISVVGKRSASVTALNPMTIFMKLFLHSTQSTIDYVNFYHTKNMLMFYRILFRIYVCTRVTHIFLKVYIRTYYRYIWIQI